jgi:ATP-dependent DNA helicase DinG
VLRRAAGTVITSATLRDDAHRETAQQGAWQAAEQRTGADKAVLPALRAAFPSPFVYARNARVFVVQNGRTLNNDDIACANAFTQLSLAAGGGTLGIFTAIARVRQVYNHSHKALERAGLALYAQHVQGADVSLCADLFRNDEDSSLIGTDAVRDGLDVPTRSLRLVVCDKIPYLRPTYLHLQRREAFGGFSYDRMLIRMRLKQAFGRLIRCASDKGAFVMLDDRGDRGLWEWLPDGVKIERLPLERIVALMPECVG